MFTPRVTYQDEIVLEKLTLEKSGLGANLDVGGQSFPTIVSRRDEHDASLARRRVDHDRRPSAGRRAQRAVSSFPGLSGIPVLRSIFGNSEKTVDQTDIVMIITPHIVRGHDMTAEDLRPMSIGTGTNVGASNGASLSLDALQATIQALGATAVQGGPGPGAPPVQTVPTSSPAPSAVAVAVPDAAGRARVHAESAWHRADSTRVQSCGASRHTARDRDTNHIDGSRRTRPQAFRLAAVPTRFRSRLRTHRMSRRSP